MHLKYIKMQKSNRKRLGKNYHKKKFGPKSSESFNVYALFAF